MFSWSRIAVRQEKTHATISTSIRGTQEEISGTEDGCYSGLLVMIGGVLAVLETSGL